MVNLKFIWLPAPKAQNSIYRSISQLQKKYFWQEEMNDQLQIQKKWHCSCFNSRQQNGRVRMQGYKHMHKRTTKTYTLEGNYHPNELTVKGKA